MTASTSTLPRIAPPPPRRTVQWRKARATLGRLIADPERTDQVFELIDALAGDAGERHFQRFLLTDDAPRLLAEKPSLLRALCDRARLEALPAGTLGREYARFMRAGGIEAQGLVDASMEADRRTGELPLDPDRDWFYARIRDMHDLWHVLTGYGRDLAGEATLLAFTHAQTRNRGILAIVLAAVAKGPKSLDLWWPRYLLRAWLRGRRAVLLAATPWEELLPLPLAEVRRRLRVSEPEQAHPGGILVAGEGTLRPAAS
ncbi:MAG TPA: Coq4 family protein [Myxococcota bacterium]|nr:Coq4 family protein [Myxococcota bacterium]